MMEAHAWLSQALSDRDCCETLLDLDAPKTYCHAIAKLQQTIEKATKSVVACLRDRRNIDVTIGYTHNVSQFLALLTRLPHTADHRDIQGELCRLFGEPYRSQIVEIERLVPKRPPPGAWPARNTEYPFRAVSGEWQAPCDETSFSRRELERYRSLAHRIADGCRRIVSGIERASR